MQTLREFEFGPPSIRVTQYLTHRLSGPGRLLSESPAPGAHRSGSLSSESSWSESFERLRSSETPIRVIHPSHSFESPIRVTHPSHPSESFRAATPPGHLSESVSPFRVKIVHPSYQDGELSVMVGAWGRGGAEGRGRGGGVPRSRRWPWAGTAAGRTAASAAAAAAAPE